MTDRWVRAKNGKNTMVNAPHKSCGTTNFRNDLVEDGNGGMRFVRIDLQGCGLLCKDSVPGRPASRCAARGEKLV